MIQSRQFLARQRHIVVSLNELSLRQVAYLDGKGELLYHLPVVQNPGAQFRAQVGFPSCDPAIVGKRPKIRESRARERDRA